MENQPNAKCVSKLQQLPATYLDTSARTKMSNSRRSSAASNYSPQYENSFPRPLNTTTRSHLSVTRPYPYARQNIWLQQSTLNKSAPINNLSTKVVSTDESEKKIMTPQTPTIPLQNQVSRERNPSATVELKQTRLEQRTLSIAHRLRRLQYSQSRTHVEAELNSTNTTVRRCLDNAAIVRDAETLNDVRSLLNDPLLEQKLETLIKLGELRPEALNCEELRQATPAGMAHILRKYESLMKKVVSLSSFSSSTSGTSSTSSALSAKSIPPNMALHPDDMEHFGRVTQSLHSHLTVLQRHYDSDATESSSGGESCDEDEKETEIRDSKPSGKFRHSSLEHRASWQWWTERAWLGSRWAWIQFQLADLEYKIRQHVDLYKQLRLRKNKTATSLTSALQRHTLDGMNSKIRSAQKNSEGESPEPDEPPLEGCARTRPVEVSSVHRRIIRTVGMYRWNKKTVVRSTINCGCIPPFAPCVACSGRLDSMEGIDAQTQTRPVRNSILEPAYHPVLAMPYRGRGIGLERKLQALWGSVKPPVRNVIWFPHNKTVISLRQKSRDNQGISTKDGSADGGSEKASRRKRSVPMLSKRPYSTANRRHGMAKLRRAKKFRRERARSDSATGRDSLVSGNLQDDNGSTPGKLGGRRTTDRHSTFDIDNIVVDPRVAAVTRVEKLQYKEIQTPGWRIHEYPELSLAKLIEDSEMEDLTEMAITARHDIKQAEEKKRFIPILFRDLRRSQLQNQSSSVDSNGASPSIISPITSVASAPAQLSSIPSEKPSEPTTPIEIGYEPFPARHFPLESEQVEEICNGNDSFLTEDADEAISPPSV